MNVRTWLSMVMVTWQAKDSQVIILASLTSFKVEALNWVFDYHRPQYWRRHFIRCLDPHCLRSRLRVYRIAASIFRSSVKMLLFLSLHVLARDTKPRDALSLRYIPRFLRLSQLLNLRALRILQTVLFFSKKASMLLAFLCITVLEVGATD